MRKSLLDTDILSEISKGINKSVLARASRYLDEHGNFTFTSISVYEALYGLKAKPAPLQAARLLELVTIHDEILPDETDYRFAADIRAAMHLPGTEIGRADPVIAACAYRRHLAMVTGNAKHYQFIVDAGFQLDLENWRDA